MRGTHFYVPSLHRQRPTPASLICIFFFKVYSKVLFCRKGVGLCSKYFILPLIMACYSNCFLLISPPTNTFSSFFCSRYAVCLEYLGNLKSNLLLDIHLHSHVETLYDLIRQKALIQYTLPFVSVDLNMMANAFKTTAAGLQKELGTLITDNQIQVLCFPQFSVA